MSNEGKLTGDSVIRVRDLEMRYGSYLVMRDLNFDVLRGEIKVIMGGSGCGKSTLLRHLIGMEFPARGNIEMLGQEVVADESVLTELRHRFGVLYQGGALWSSMTLAENVALPMETFTRMHRKEIAEVVAFKLALVGLSGFGDRYPAELSGGMRKRAGLARAIALDPEILFVDEPSAGLDPLSARRLDELILALRDSLQTTVVIVTHELDSIFTIADTALFLDAESKTAIADANPHAMRDGKAEVPERVRTFLRRGAASELLAKSGGIEDE
jgi:phospholipid/cholesterol/gamma-HCH transport system ATP-binding protein